VATYISLIHWTDQGVKNARGLVQRAQQFRAECEQRGLKVIGLYSTQGRYDAVIALEAPDEQTLMAGLCALESLGNVRTETQRAFTEAEMDVILRKI
jgi:uncharacterized protein with GYD domain